MIIDVAHLLWGNMYTAEKRKVTRTGICSSGWRLGYGYVRGTLTVKTEIWCVMHNGKVYAECRSEKTAKEISKIMNKTEKI